MREIAAKRARVAAAKQQALHKAEIESEQFLLQIIQEGGPMKVAGRRRDSVQALMQEFEVDAYYNTIIPHIHLLNEPLFNHHHHHYHNFKQ